jgi:thiol-disulfide isomerase/thioredoxin
MMDRRTMLAGMIAIAGERMAGAAPPQRPLFEGTPFAGNAVARSFQRMNLALPAVPLLDEHGATSLHKLRGRATILSLWAEWCVPCLIEARDLAVLRRKYANRRFDIVSLLTSSKKPLDYRGAHDRLATMSAGDLPLMIEPNGGAAALAALSPKPSAAMLAVLPPSFRSKGSLPCTLLVDSSGRICGGSLGTPVLAAPGQEPGGGTKILTEEQKRALAGDGRTAWSSGEGDAFVRALASGLLDRIR